MLSNPKSGSAAARLRPGSRVPSGNAVATLAAALAGSPMPERRAERFAYMCICMCICVYGMCVYVCMCVCVYVCIYVYMYIYIYIHKYTQTHSYLSLSLYIYIYTHTAEGPALSPRTPCTPHTFDMADQEYIRNIV